MLLLIEVFIAAHQRLGHLPAERHGHALQRRSDRKPHDRRGVVGRHLLEGSDRTLGHQRLSVGDAAGTLEHQGDGPGADVLIGVGV